MTRRLRLLVASLVRRFVIDDEPTPDLSQLDRRDGRR